MSTGLLSLAQAQGSPLIDGDLVTFIWQGEKAPRLIGDFTDWQNGRPVDMEDVAPHTWIYKDKFPRDGYLEYIFVDGDERMVDPLNKRRVSNGIGGVNQFFYMPGAAPTPLTRRSRKVPEGRVILHKVATDHLAAGKERLVGLYQPAVAEAVPLVVVWDGLDFYRRARLTRIVDNLIQQGRIQPIALAMVDNRQETRFLEYACNESTLAFLVTKVLPLAHRELNLIDVEKQPGVFGLLGASMGGLISLFLGARIPHIFGKVLCMSGAFNMGVNDMVIFDLLRNAPRLPLKLWLNIGQYDFTVLISANQRMFELLKQKGYPFEYHVYPAGHNYTAWRNDLWRGLEYLFGR